MSTQYKFADYPKKGIVTISQGYVSLVIVDQIADVDLADPGQLALAEKKGGEPVVVNVVEKKSSKKPAETDSKNR